MYIRRKVFSVLSDETGEERLFSTNEVEYMGYEDFEVDDDEFQREFSDDEDEEEDEESNEKLKKAAKVLGISTAALGTAIVGGKLAGKGLRKISSLRADKALKAATPNRPNKILEYAKHKNAAGKHYMSEKPWDTIAKGVDSMGRKIKDKFNKASHDHKFKGSNMPAIIVKK